MNVDGGQEGPCRTRVVLFTSSVRYKHFKLRFDRTTGASALHDLQDDPGELEDVSSSFPEGRTELMSQLEAFMAAPEQETPTITLTPEEIDRLRSLGYLR